MQSGWDWVGILAAAAEANVAGSKALNTKLMWTDYRILEQQDRSATRPPAGGSEMHS